MSNVRNRAATYQTLESFNSGCTCGEGAYGWQCSTCYPSRTVRGMYQQEQQIAKAEEAGLIVTAADLQHMHSCDCCGDNGAYHDGLCANCWNELKAHNE